MILGALDSLLSPVANQKGSGESVEDPPPFFVNSPQNEFPSPHSPRVENSPRPARQVLQPRPLSFKDGNFVFQPPKKSQEGPGPHSLTL